MRPRLTIPLAFLLSALLITALPRTAAASVHAAAHSPGSGTAASSGTDASSGSTADVCSLSGLVRTNAPACPGNSRLRRQGLPSIVNPVHIVKKVLGAGASSIETTALSAIVGWVASGAESALKETAKVIGETTSPELTSSWFSSSYWRVAGIAALLTIPFLCAAAIHALVRSDLGLLTRAAFGYLPLSLLAVGVASQLTMLLLAGTDEMSSIVASAAAHADSVFLATTSVTAIAASVATGDPFVAFLAAIITVAATLSLWLELLVRDAAVYVIVLMLPMFFAAMVWPARRTLAIRAIETLIALILSKFAIVAVLSLGGSALGHSTIPGVASVLTGATLVLLAAFTPWALLRILPLHEVASAAAGGLSQGPRQAIRDATDAAMELGDGSLAFGTAAVERLAPKLLSDGNSSGLGDTSRGGANRSAAGARSTAPFDGEADTDASWSEPGDADVAEPVTSAMSGSHGSIGPGDAERGTDSDDGPPSGARQGPADARPGGSDPAAPRDGTAAARPWSLNDELPRVAGGENPPISLGEDLRQLDHDRGAWDAGTDAPTAGADAPSGVQPPLLAGDDPIGPRPTDPRLTGTGRETDEPPSPEVAAAPADGLDPFDGRDRGADG